jgi:tetratricopeptide (TPR) repeat protein
LCFALSIGLWGGAWAGVAQGQATRLGERVEAIVRLKKVVAEHPENFAARVELANALDDTGDSAGAIVQYREAIRLSPGYAPAYRNLALAHIRQGQWVAAESAARDAVRIEPKNAQARCDLAVALGSQHKMEEAAREWQQAIEFDKEGVAKYAGFVRSPAEAEEFSRAAPPQAAAWLTALTLRDAGDRPRAIRELEKLQATSQNFPLASYSLAELYAQSGRQRESEGALQRAMQSNPGFAESAKNTASASTSEEAKVRLKTGAQQLSQLKGMVPNLIVMQGIRGASEEQKSKARELLKESAIRIRALLDQFPEDAEGYVLLGDALRALNEPRAAWAYETSVRAARGRQAVAAGRAWLGLGLLQEKAGRDALAMEMFSQGLLAAPEDSELLNAAAWLAATSTSEPPRDPAKAMEWARKAVDATKEKNAVYLRTLAEAYFTVGQVNAAVRAIRVAISLEPDVEEYKRQLERFKK